MPHHLTIANDVVNDVHNDRWLAKIPRPQKAATTGRLRAFGVSETCFRYSPKRDDENEMIADVLVGLTNVHKTWGFGCHACHPPLPLVEPGGGRVV